MQTQSEFLATAVTAVKNAEAIILKYFNQDIGFSTKADLSPVTIADEEAERIIIGTIRAAFPDHTFYGEESEKTDLTNHRGYTWIIDPIDGTKSYMHGMPLFGTQLALMKDGEMVLGVSNAPLIHELMTAEKGHGCFLNGQPVTVSKTAKLEDAYMSFGSMRRFEYDSLSTRMLSLMKNVKWARGIGDFWGYHLVAQGKVDIMTEPWVSIWDIAAAKVIVEEAGGTLTQVGGQPITPSSRTVLATNGRLHSQVVDRLKEPNRT